MVKKKTFEEIADSFDPRGTVDLELLVLRAHTYLEAMLRRVLSDRLGVGEGNTGMARLGFWYLAQLALGAPEDRELLGLVDRLNGVRNEIAHGMSLDPKSVDLERFVCDVLRRQRQDYRWPMPHEDEARRSDFCHALTFVARTLIDRMTPRYPE